MAKRRKKKLRLKYKNFAILLAALLVLVLAIVWICTPNDKPQADDDLNNDVQQDDIGLPPLEDEEEVNMTTDPTLQTSYVFTAISKTEADLGIGELVLVNNNIAFRGTVTEDDLVVVREKKNQSYSVKDYSVMVKPVTMDAVNNMMLDFYTAMQNDDVMVISGHRTIEYQQGLYDDELAETGLTTSTLVSRAGYSEHHTGYVVDFKLYHDDGTSEQFDGTGDYAWIMDNCHTYGFINRYPAGKEKLTLIDNEPWHFRYVGPVHASIITEYGFCLEEYIEFLKNYTIDTGFLLKAMPDGKQYIIYYVPMVDPANTSVCIPLMADRQTPYPYEISGNNIDGWILTVDVTDFSATNVELTPEITPDATPDVNTEGNAEGEE